MGTSTALVLILFCISIAAGITALRVIPKDTLASSLARCGAFFAGFILWPFVVVLLLSLFLVFWELLLWRDLFSEADDGSTPRQGF